MESGGRKGLPLDRTVADCVKANLSFPGGSLVKNLPTNVGDGGLIPGLGKSPGEGKGYRSSILAWEIPWTEEPDGLQSMKSQKNQTRLSD